MAQEKHCTNYGSDRGIGGDTNSSGASAISEGGIFIYSCSAQLISFEVDSISKEINCAEHEYMNMSPSVIALVPLLDIKGVRVERAASVQVKPSRVKFC